MRRSSAGFTLVELMVVVAIVGVLSALAIPNFQRYQYRTKVSEGNLLVESLRKAQAALVTDPRPVVYGGLTAAGYSVGQYWDLGGTKIPAAGIPGTVRLPWDQANDVARAGGLDWSPEGSTFFDFQITVQGCPGVPATPHSGACYQIGARSDVDGDSAMAFRTLVRPATDGTVPSAFPAILSGAALGVPGGTCGTAAAPIHNLPCALTGPEVY